MDLAYRIKYNVLFIKEAVNVPVILDVGIACTRDSAIAIGADGILTNTAMV